MARLRRRWRILKWAGLVLSLLLGVTWLSSLRWAFGYVVADTSGPPALRRGGGIDAYQPARLIVNVRQGVFDGYYITSRLANTTARPGWYVKRSDSTELFWRPIGLFNGYTWYGLLPLWIPCLIVTACTVVLWYLEHHRTLPGHCQKCGYNLTGNMSGICPECGEKIDAQAVPKA